MRLNFLVRRQSLAFGSLFCLFWLVCFMQLNVDFGWHLVSGQYFLAHGIPSHDVFSYTAPNFPWINHEWGSDVITALIYGLGGYGLVSVLYASLWSAALLIVGWRTRLTTLLIAGVALLPFINLRPTAWTMCLFAIILRLLQSRRHQLQWIIPPLFILWANLHGGFVVGLLAIAYFAVRERRRQLLYVLALSGLATLINPYGPRLYIEIARTLFDPLVHSQVSEWTRFAIAVPSWAFVTLWLVGSIHLIIRQPRAWMRLSNLLFIATLSAARNLPVFVIASLQELDDFLGQIGKAIARRRFRRGAPLAILILSYACIILSLFYGLYVSIWPVMNRETPFPVRQATYVQTHGCSAGHMFNSFEYGGYLLWKLPSQQVYIDSRMTVWPASNGQTYITNYIKLLENPETYRVAFQRYDIRCAIVLRNALNQGLIDQLLKDHWAIKVKTDNSILLQAPHG